MATATTKSHTSTSTPRPTSGEAAVDHWVLRTFDAIYRFLASLKLAVFSLSTLAAVLAFGTFFESWYGTGAVQEYIYRSKSFAILLAFLGVNILCAALIRYPWKKRQTGFVITHAGLLIVLSGSFVSLRWSDEGQVGIIAGYDSNQLVRIDHSVVRVQKVDAKTGEPTTETVVPFYPGAFPWQAEKLALLTRDASYQRVLFAARVAFAIVVASLLGLFLLWAIRKPTWLTLKRGAIAAATLVALIAGLGVYVGFSPSGPRREVLTEPGESFGFEVVDYLPASTAPFDLHEPGADGVPMLRASLLIRPPGATQATDALGGRGWLVAQGRLARGVIDQGPALLAFQFVEGEHAAEKVDDFLHPPKDPLADRLARIHYRDRRGQDRVYDWILKDDQTGKTVALPDSDLSVTFDAVKQMDLLDEHSGGQGALLRQAIGERFLSLATFRVRAGSGPEIEHNAWGSLPMIPSTIPNAQTGLKNQEIVRIGLFEPPTIDKKASFMGGGRLGSIEVLVTADQKMYYRAFGREGLMGLGPVTRGEEFKVFGGGANMPMRLSVRVDDFIRSGVTREMCEPIVLPKGELDKGIPAALVKMSVGGETKEFWLRRTPSLEPAFQDVAFRDGHYRVSYDFDRRPFEFDLKLVEFEPGKDPGSSSPATYKSDVLLTDSKLGLSEKPIAITMNEPLTHRGWTFYQSSFSKVTDPETGQRDGVFMSFFQVHYDPAWQIVYSGCLLVVAGTFVQFYMRAGIFTDGGKQERARAEAKALAKARNQTREPAPAPPSDGPADLEAL